MAMPFTVKRYTFLLDPSGKEVIRYVGKNNSDRLSIEALAAKITELSKP
jgi:peroxiredoxin Q/BCP